MQFDFHCFCSGAALFPFRDCEREDQQGGIAQTEFDRKSHVMGIIPRRMMQLQPCQIDDASVRGIVYKLSCITARFGSFREETPHIRFKVNSAVPDCSDPVKSVCFKENPFPPLIRFILNAEQSGTFPSFSEFIAVRFCPVQQIVGTVEREFFWIF